MALEDGGLVQILAPDPGAEMAQQEAMRRRQAMAQLLAQQQAEAAPMPEFPDMGGSSGGGEKQAENNSILAGLLADNAGASSAGPNTGGMASVGKYDFGGPTKVRGIGMDAVVSKLLKQGASPEQAATLAAISQPESAGNIYAHNGRRPDDSYGLLQINMLDRMGPERRARYGLTRNEDLYDPDTNLRVGLDLARRRGNFNDWSTYQNGAYRRYLPAAQDAVQRALGKRSDAGDVTNLPKYASLENTANDASPVGQKPPVSASPASLANPSSPYSLTRNMNEAQPPVPTAPLTPSRTGKDELTALANKNAPGMAKAAPQAQEEDWGPFSFLQDIGNGIGELFGASPAQNQAAAQGGVQVAGGGEQYYPTRPHEGHGLIGNLIRDAMEQPVPIPQSVQALANSPRQSDRIRYELMVNGGTMNSAQLSVYKDLLDQATAKEQAAENRYTQEVDSQGRLIQRGPGGKMDILDKPKEITAPEWEQKIKYAHEHPEDAPYLFPGQGNDGSQKIQGDIAAREKALRDRGIDPNDPRNRDYVLTGKFPREDATPLTATDKKAILEADEHVETSQNAVTALQRAKEASKKAWGFKGAGVISGLAAPFSEDAQNTVDLDNIVTSDALESLKATFGGNPTEGERAILLQIQGSSSLPDKERQRIFDRAIAAANRRLEFNKKRASDMRGGDYYTEGHNPNNAPSAAPTEQKNTRIRYDANGNVVQ